MFDDTDPFADAPATEKPKPSPIDVSLLKAKTPVRGNRPDKVTDSNEKSPHTVSPVIKENWASSGKTIKAPSKESTW